MTKGSGTLFLCFLGIRHSSCDADMLETFLSSRIVSGNVLFMSFGLCFCNLISSELDNCNVLFLLSCSFVRSVSVCVPDPDLSDDGSDLFLIIVFSDFSVSVESVPDLFSEVFYFRQLFSLDFYLLSNP